MKRAPSIKLDVLDCAWKL